MQPVFLLTLRQLSGRWRIGIMTVLAAAPVLLTIAIVNSNNTPSVQEFEVITFSGLLAGSISPLIVLAVASAAFANELEDRTLANLTLSPIPRWQIVVPKLLATVTVSAPFIAVSAFVSSQLAYAGDLQATFAVTTASVIGVLLYASVFVWLGLVTTQAIGAGLLYIVLWEGFFSGWVSGVKYLSIRSYSIGWMHGMDVRRFAGWNNLPFTAAVIVSGVVFGGFLFLTIRRLRRMDVP